MWLQVRERWPDKAPRYRREEMMEDPRVDPPLTGNPPMPFDGKRVVFRRFEPVVEVWA